MQGYQVHQLTDLLIPIHTYNSPRGSSAYWTPHKAWLIPDAKEGSGTKVGWGEKSPRHKGWRSLPGQQPRMASWLWVMTAEHLLYDYSSPPSSLHCEIQTEKSRASLPELLTCVQQNTSAQTRVLYIRDHHCRETVPRSTRPSSDSAAQVLEVQSVLQ